MRVIPEAAGGEQLSLDFSASAAQRHARAVRAAARGESKPLTLFESPPNIDVHLHSPLEAVATITGDPDRAVYFLSGLVGGVRVLKTRRVAFPAESLDRLLWVRPPARVTVDAAASAVGRALWAAKLGLRPLRVRRDGRRLVALSVRWPPGLRVVDAPWTTIAVLVRLGMPLDVEPSARRLMLTKLGESGTSVASAGLAGSAVALQTSRPDLLESLGLPGLSFAGEPRSGLYRMPLLASEVLLDLPQIARTADLDAAIRRTSTRPRPLRPKDGFPWQLYPFQARDASRAIRILETTGGVLLAGEMGSGKGLGLGEPVLTPAGPVAAGRIQPGALLVGASGVPVRVRSVFRRGVLPTFLVTFSDGTDVVTDADHLWALTDEVTGSSVLRSTGDLLAGGLRARSGVWRWSVPACAPVASAGPDADDALPARRVRLRRVLAGLGRPGLRVLRRSDGWVRLPSLADAESLAFLVRSLGGFASPPRRSRHSVGWLLHLVLPPRPGGSPLRKHVVAVEPAGPAETVCFEVEAPDGLFLLGGFTPTHNTTVSLALVHELDLWPLIVVAPLSAFSTWARQLAEMGRSYYLATENPRLMWERIERRDFDVLVVSYDRLHAVAELVESQNYRAIIADEVQRIRTPGSRRSRALRSLAASVPSRIGLSGTPLTNSVADLLPLGAFLAPGEWKPRANAKDLADLYPGDPVEAVAEHLGALMVRRRMEDTGATLPKRNDHRVYVQLTPDQRRALEDLQDEAQQAKAEGAFDDNSGRMHAFARLQRMRQVVNSPRAAGVPGPNPKVRAAIDLAEDFLAMGRKGVLFCADRTTFRELGEELDAAGIGWVGIWGSTPPHERIENERRFHSDPEVKVVVCTIQAGSESWSASPTATWLISTAYVYAPSTLAQMEARVHRMNSDPDGPEIEICYIHAQVPGGSLDDRMVQILEQKRQLFAQVVDRTEHVESTKVHYSMSDLVFLLTGERDDRKAAAEADARSAVEREQDRKRHARSTLYRNKGRNKADPSLERDSGEMAVTHEQWLLDAVDEALASDPEEGGAVLADSRLPEDAFDSLDGED